MRSWFIVLTCALLSACSSVPPSPRPDLLDDAAFAPASERIAAADVFAVSEPMREYLRQEIVPQLRQSGRQRALVDALYTRRKLRLDYDSAVTRNASQAFDARAGNCLSLVIMTAALARELGMTVTFQSAWAEEAWSRSSDLYFRSGHVNLTLGRRAADTGAGYDLYNVTIDFLPHDMARKLRTTEITEQTVLAMFMNNRAAEALVQGRLDDAYWWAREGVRQDPGFMSVFNTLGVIYRRHGDLARAEQVFAHVLAHESQNTRAMGNLAQVLEQSGRRAEADAVKSRLARLEPDPPFYFFNLGLTAMQRKDFATARDMFAKEVRRADYNGEFHFWLGLAQFQLGNLDEAGKELALAMENSSQRADRDLYAAKLAWLKSQQGAKGRL
jgi:tetratricopeptide (TPR) repeat protein